VLVLKNRVCPEFTLLNIYFLSFRILNRERESLLAQTLNLRLPRKTESALEFFTVFKYFLTFRIFEKLELALKLSSWGGGGPPASYATG